MRTYPQETPPRAWGRHRRYLCCEKVFRNTPTGVGKTTKSRPDGRLLQKHPHGRGEDPRTTRAGRVTIETPPRAWGRPSSATSTETRFRNTPTGVGKTSLAIKKTLAWWKHPHGRGEDHGYRRRRAVGSETPPRAWGRRSISAIIKPQSRNTPTGVGKTTTCSNTGAQCWKHPHGRGEDGSLMESCHAQWETPPRAWGRLSSSHSNSHPQRNTPTGVGKTLNLPVHASIIEKHPHGRGEDTKATFQTCAKSETPPRAWGRLR